MSRITKHKLLSIIKRFPFDSLVIPNRFATERDEDIPGFIGALMEALQATLLETAPANVSPRKLMEPSAHLDSEPATPTPTLTSISGVVTAERERIGVPETIPFMLRLRDAQEFDDEETKSIDVGSTGDTLKLRREALRNMALAGFPLHRTSNLLLDERPSSSNLPPPPDLPFDSKPKPMSPARRALMKDLMAETRRTLHYTLVDLAKDRALGFPWFA
jgi:hypothetical protein